MTDSDKLLDDAKAGKIKQFTFYYDDDGLDVWNFTNDAPPKCAVCEKDADLPYVSARDKDWNVGLCSKCMFTMLWYDCGLDEATRCDEIPMDRLRLRFTNACLAQSVHEAYTETQSAFDTYTARGYDVRQGNMDELTDMVKAFRLLDKTGLKDEPLEKFSRAVEHKIVDVFVDIIEAVAA